MKIIAFVLSFCCAITCVAQLVAPDIIKTNTGDLTIQPITHSTMVLTCSGKTIYVDPTGGNIAFKGLAAPDIIIITDIHGDHMHLETLNALAIQNASIVAPAAVVEKLPELLKSKAKTINNGEQLQVSGILINAIPMYNLPETADSRHPKGRGNGYVLTFGEKRLYISGDTEDIDEMRSLKNIDVAFVCMNSPTMDMTQAASAVLAFKPRIVYPFHYRGNDVEVFKKLVNDGSGAIEVRLRNWYPTK